MTIETLSLFSGDIGTNPTLATEPWATSVAGTVTNMTYEAGVDGALGQSVQVTGARDFVWTPPAPVGGVSHWRIGMWINRVSGTQTAGLAYMLMRSGTVNRGDAFVRNQNGGQIALRGGAGGTTYAGQSTRTIANGEAWWSELEYESDGTTHTARLHLFHPGNATGTADETFTSGLAGPVDNVRLFNPTGATGLTVRFGQLMRSDGEQIRQGVQVGSLDFISNSWGVNGELVMVGKVANASSVTLSMDGQTASTTPDSAGYFRVRVEGLTPGALVPNDLLVDDVSRRTGTIKTLRNTLNGLRILWGSCFDSITSGFFANATARDPDLVAMLGDWSYMYLNGVFASTDVAVVRATREPVLRAALPQAFFSERVVSHTYSDTDSAGGNADGTYDGFVAGSVQAAYRQQFAHPDLPLPDCGARSWVIEQVRFIQTDEITLSSLKSAPDNSSKTKLGVSQKAWFKAQIDAAAAAGQSVVWFGDGPWIEPAQVTGNSWRAYNTERTEIGAYIQASGVKLIRLHGDTHTLFVDDGTNNNWGGFPTASAAPFHTTANPYGYPVSGDGNGGGQSYPPTPTQINGARHYGIADFTSADGAITLTIRGFSSTAAEPTEVERFNMAVDLTPTADPSSQPWAEVRIGADLVDAMFVGSDQVWP
ncbi:phosphoesterase [Microbacterium phage Pioneer3]|nr:phosphoesterase [Microbacterium phage Pioneer3]